MADVFPAAMEAFSEGTLAWDDPATDFQVVLLALGGWTLDLDAQTVAEVTGELSTSGTGYSRKSITGRTVAQSGTGASRVVVLDSTAPVEWTAINAGNVNQALVIRASDGLLVYHDVFTTQATQGGLLQLPIPADGWIRWGNG